MARFGDESKLIRLIEKAKKNPRSMERANEVETALLAKWRSDNLPLSSVWERLKFNNYADDALSSGKLSMFSKYISKYYPDNEMPVLERFTTKYREVAVAKALELAKANAATKEFATKLQAQQLEGWLANQKSAVDVFKLLKVKEDGTLFMFSPKLEILTEYIKLFNSNKNPQDQAYMIRVGSPYPLIAATADQYQNTLFKVWFRSKIEPRNIYPKFLNAEEGDLEKKIVTQYAEYYDAKTIPQVYTFNQPRRS
ncbi:hypothetical protein PC129_g17454 [Phytophthora cactorum]|uniref:RxLR effector protein n=1 Tax=Phytophthora cactorum TaxID=29920 RepID=A0A8T1DUI1_9STRA|nr:hypothetical protein PC112_g15921 [Phytophthora cactorum]KAG2814172.1 hypothetical protein PC111_g14092 [Phytophthora cactorum]KAG2851259.1 hypothetical protein PC113_g16071 [Phytophthora cactorum]KAG2898710.1 hypothetical protein PC114_g14184 [Phytophthora cactorum]KAG2943449.1 hypothetical protein PC115_g787 [Phytophthora cactorum]